VEDRLFNDLRYYIDCTETMKLGWKPEVSFEDGLAKTSTSSPQHLPLWCTSSWPVGVW
jgi:dTDP-D-glucose 4,6-dehydratase